MGSPHIGAKWQRSLRRVARLMILLLGLGLIPIGAARAQSAAMPAARAAETATPAACAASTRSSHNWLTPYPVLINPLRAAFITGVPSSDGSQVFFSAAGVSTPSSPLFLNIYPGLGPAGHAGRYMMTISGTDFVATAGGFPAGVDIGTDLDDTLNITTTVGLPEFHIDPINFQRAFVQPSQLETIVVDSNGLVVDMPIGTVAADMYLLAMSTNVPPGDTPPGYTLIGKTYTLSPSGGLTETNQLMTLKLGYQEPLPDGGDPHTLAIMRWNESCGQWDLLGGDLFDANVPKYVAIDTKRFGIYALASTPTWRDSFKESNLSGVQALNNTQWRSVDDTITLAGGATSGTVTSIPITPTLGAISWGTLHYNATVGLNTSLQVDLLDANNNVVLSNVSDGADLSTALPLALYPGLKLRARLSTSQPGLTPELHQWSLGWTTQSEVYLPIAIRS
jgi:hypothetical protein